jgi:DNA-binding PadR family transcriptional regulator
MPRGDFLGEFEQMVLLAVARLGKEAYGMSVLDEIHDRTGLDVAVASVYAALDRMQRAGLVSSASGAPTPERGGRAKRFFSIEPAGVTALQKSRLALNSLWDGLQIDGIGAE